MAVLQNTIKWVSNVDELRAQLKKGEDQIVATRASADKLIQSLSGDRLIAAAHRYAAAVTEMGGVAKLTAAEQERVNAVVQKAIDKYTALGQQAPTALKQLAEATKQAGKESSVLSQWVDDLGKQILGTAAGFVSAQAVIGAVQQAVHLLTEEFKTLTLHGAAVADVQENFDGLTAQANRLGASLLGTLRQGTHGTINDFELMKAANQDLAAGLNLTDQQFGVLAKGAFALAQATGSDVKTAFDTMNDAMLTGRTRALALLTGRIDEAAAEEKYADRLGVTADRLSEAGKLEARRQAILDGVTAATKRLGEQTDGLDERVAQAQAAWANFENQLGATVATSKVLNAGLEGLRDVVAATFGPSQDDLIKSIATTIDSLAIHTVDFGLAATQVATVVVTAWSLVKVPVLAVETALVGLVDGIGEVLLKGEELAAKLHLVPPSEVDQMRDTVTQLRAMTASLAAETAEAAKGVVGQSALNQSIDRVGGALFGLRDKMVAAQQAHTALTQETRRTTAATTEQESHLKALDAPLKALTKSLAEMAVKLTPLPGHFVLVRDQIATYGEEAAKLVQQADVIGVHVPASVRAIAEAWNELRREDLVRQVTVTWVKDFDEFNKKAAEKMRGTARTIADALLAVGPVDLTKTLGDAIIKNDALMRTSAANTRDLRLKMATDTFTYQQVKLGEWVANEKAKVDVSVGNWREAYAAIEAEGGAKLAELVRAHEDAVAQMEASINNWRNLTIHWLGEIPGFIQQAFTGGGGLAGAMKALSSKIGGDIGGHLFEAGGALNKLGNSLTGGMTKLFGKTFGDAFGLALPGIGQAIGALAGPLIGGIKKLFGGVSEEEKKGRETVKAFEAQVASTLSATQKAEAGGQAWKQTAIGVRDAFLATGRSAAEADAAVQRLWASSKKSEEEQKAAQKAITDVLDLQKKALDALPGILKDVSGGMNAISAGTIGAFNKVRQTLNSAGDQLVGLQDKEATLTAKIDELNRKPHLTDVQKAQLQTWQNQLTDVQTEIGALTAKQQAASDAFTQIGQTGQESFDRVGRLAVSSFNAALAGGQSFAQALESIGPTLDDLTQAQNAWGFAAGDTLQSLLGFRKFAADNKELMGTLDGVNQLMSGLHKMGLLTQQDFTDLSHIAGDTYAKMTAGGISGDQALRAMQPTLQKLWELHKDQGLAIDDNTQGLIDQAAQAGIVGEQMRDPQQQMLDVLKAIAKVLGADLPDAAEKGVKGVTDALHKIPKDIDVDVNVNPPGVPAGGPRTEAAATGGLVRAFGIQHFDFGGIVKAGGWRAPWTFAPVGTDVVPAMLTPGELILNQGQQAQIASLLEKGVEIAQGTIAGGKAAGLTIYETISPVFQISAVDASGIDEVCEKQVMPRLTLMIEDRRRGYTARWQQALGTT